MFDIGDRVACTIGTRSHHMTVVSVETCSVKIADVRVPITHGSDLVICELENGEQIKVQRRRLTRSE